jgi:cell division protein FtsI/penicillin-binding protein 2
VLSIDIRLQKLVEDMFGDRRGALVAIDPRNGEVLAFVSKPTFDPNLFVEGIDVENWRALNESVDKPLLNRALRGTYPPGSTYKPFMALAALETGTRNAAPPSTTRASGCWATTASAATATGLGRWTCTAASSSPATPTTTRWPTRWAWTRCTTS